MCGRLAQVASRVNSSHGSDVYRINDLVKTVKKWRSATVLKRSPASRSPSLSRGDANERMRARGEKVHCGAMTFAVSGIEPRWVFSDWVA